MLRLALLIVLVLGGPAGAASWRLDPGTRVSVDVDWRGTHVELRFPEVSGAVAFDPGRPEAARARITVASRSVESGLPPVDALVTSRDYLGAAEHPTMTFELDRLVRTSPQTADVFGRLTLRGVTRPVAFKAQVIRYGPAEGAPGRFEAGFDIAGAVDRTAFGSTGGLPDVPAEIGVRIRLLMTSE